MGNQLKNKTIIGYGVGNFGFGIVFQMVASYLMFFSTAVLHMSASLVGIIISISVLWDAFSDPLMGYVSDHTNFRMGRRRGYILIGGLMAALFNVLMWQVSLDVSETGKFFWLLFCVLMIKSFLTVYGTPYTALGAEMTLDYNERSKVQAIRAIFFLLGIAFVTAFGMIYFFKPTELYPIGQLNPEAYKQMGWAASILMVLSMMVTLMSTRGQVSERPEKQVLKIKKIFLDMYDARLNKSYFSVVKGYLYTNISTALLGSVGLHIFTYTFSYDNVQIGIIYGTQLLVSILAQPYWLSLARRIDKKDTVSLGLKISVLGSCLFLIYVFLRPFMIVNYHYMLLFAVIMGFGSSGLFSMPYSMVADTLDLEYQRSNKRLEGTYYGLLTLGYKLSQSLAFFIFGFVLDWIKFNPDLPVQSIRTLILLGLTLPVGSIVVFLMAIHAYGTYNVDESLIKEIQGKINP